MLVSPVLTTGPLILPEMRRGAHADLIVMATHGRTGLEHMVLGGVAEKMVTPCPVLTVKYTENPAVQRGG